MEISRSSTTSFPPPFAPWPTIARYHMLADEAPGGCFSQGFFFHVISTQNIAWQRSTSVDRLNNARSTEDQCGKKVFEIDFLYMFSYYPVF